VQAARSERAGGGVNAVTSFTGAGKLAVDNVIESLRDWLVRMNK